VDHFDVVIVGAGLSGIGTAHHIESKCPWASYVVLEGRDDVGGTWDLFRYPGIRSDSDMFTLGYGFRPWTGAKAIADGPDILQYLKDTATATGVDKRIRFGHRVVRADWSNAEAKWRVEVELVGTGVRVEITCGFLLACTGYYRYDHGYQPDFQGLDQFAGTVVHPQHWPEDLDYEGRRVVVIGSGATAVTLVPALAERARHVTMLQRSPSYIAPLPNPSPVDELLRRLLPTRWSVPARFLHLLSMQGSYRLARRHPRLVKRVLRAEQKRLLPPGYDVDTHFTPRYEPWDQRFCFAPNGDLFGAIRAGRASVVTDEIDRFTSRGVLLRSGTELEADIVVSATGLELLFLGGMAIAVDGEQLELPGRLTYKGMMLEGIPNLAFTIGYTNASWTLRCELIAMYVCRLLNHMHRRGLRRCAPVNDDATVVSSPIMGLDSGYIRRSAHLLPRQGSAMPWQVRQSYLRDVRATKMAPIDDGALVFSG